ncbi:unnamed protein product, partial [Staurois parvus]
METAMANVRQQIAELQEFGVTHQEKVAKLESIVDRQQGEIQALQRQLLNRDDTSSHKPQPSKFNGDRRRYRVFLNQCRIYFQMYPAAFTSEKKKVMFNIGLLTGEALAWASPYIEQNHGMLNDFDTFLTTMNQVFDDPNRCATAEAKLHSLRQGRHSVAEYTAEFRSWIADTTWNPAAQKSQFRQGLSEQVKDELAR